MAYRNEIRRRYYEETVMILNLMPYRASYPILKLVYSAHFLPRNLETDTASILLPSIMSNLTFVPMKGSPEGGVSTWPILRS